MHPIVVSPIGIRTERNKVCIYFHNTKEQNFYVDIYYALRIIFCGCMLLAKFHNQNTINKINLSIFSSAFYFYFKLVSFFLFRRFFFAIDSKLYIVFELIIVIVIVMMMIFECAVSSTTYGVVRMLLFAVGNIF